MLINKSLSTICKLNSTNTHSPVLCYLLMMDDVWWGQGDYYTCLTTAHEICSQVDTGELILNRGENQFCWSFLTDSPPQFHDHL